MSLVQATIIPLGCDPNTLTVELPNPFPTSPDYARHLCRLCLCSREQTARQRLARIEWFKWPSADITRLYEQVVGEQLPTSEHISELHCEACAAWLEGTLRRIGEFKAVSARWTEELRLNGCLDVEIETADEELEDIAGDAPTEQKVDDLKSNGLSTPLATSERDELLVKADKSTVILEMLVDVSDGEPVCKNQHFLESEEVEFLVTDEHDEIDDHSVHIDEADECEEEHLLDEEDEDENDHDPDDEEENDNKNMDYTCDLCAASFSRRQHLLQHFRERHKQCNTTPNPTPAKKQDSVAAVAPLLRCPHCDPTCPPEHRNIGTLRRHIERHHTANAGGTDDGGGCRQSQDSRPAARDRLRCDLCTAAYLRPATLQRHYTSHHPGADFTQLQWRMCNVCLRQFPSPAEATAHREAVHERWRCRLCQKLCSCEQSLRRHELTHSGKERTFQCAVCACTYVTGHQLRMHHRRKHTAERPFACEAEGCGKRYAERSELNVHWKSRHSAQRWRCEHCGMQFGSAKYLGYHVAKEHTGGFRFFECRVCEPLGTRKFVNTRLLNAHMAVHHPDVVVMQDDVDDEMEEAATS